MSLYSLHRAIRDVEKDIIFKSNEIDNISKQLEDTKLDNIGLKAQDDRRYGHTSSSDSEDDEIEYKVKSEVIQSTTRYIRRIQFLNSFCDRFIQIPPLQVNMEQ